MTKSALEALVNALLAPDQPITANGMHKPSMQKVIDELYDANSRGAVLSGVDVSVSLNTSDKVFVIRGGVAKLVDKSQFGVATTMPVWNFPSGAFPTATGSGQMWYTDAEYTADDGFTYSQDTLLISKAAGTGSSNFIKKQ